MSVVPKLNASICSVRVSKGGYIVKGKEARLTGRGKKLTESVGGIHGKEKGCKTETLRDRCPAVDGEGPLDRYVVHVRECIL